MSIFCLDLIDSRVLNLSLFVPISCHNLFTSGQFCDVSKTPSYAAIVSRVLYAGRLTGTSTYSWIPVCNIGWALAKVFTRSSISYKLPKAANHSNLHQEHVIWISSRDNFDEKKRDKCSPDLSCSVKRCTSSYLYGFAEFTVAGNFQH